MSEARVYSPPNRLSKVLAGPGQGRSADEMLNEAAAGLKAMEASLCETVDGQVARILRLHARGPDAMRAASLELGDAALNVAEIAGAAGRAGIGDAARGLRAMIDAHHQTDLWHADAIAVHVAALALLSGPAAPAPAAAAVILRKLHRVRFAVGVPD